jgi:putative addiction module killer protein
MIETIETDDYLNWLNNLNRKEHAQVRSRIERLEEFEHFGDVKYLRKALSELRWKNGWRIYFSFAGHKKIILIIGGNKNEQEKDIKKAKIFIKEHSTH